MLIKCSMEVECWQLLTMCSKQQAVYGEQSWHIRNIQMKASLCSAWTYFKLCQPFSVVSLVLRGVFCMPPIGFGLLMKGVFNLVKCCRDHAFDICMDGMVLQWRMWTNGLEKLSLLFSIYRGHYAQKDRAASRELTQAYGGYTCP